MTTHCEEAVEKPTPSRNNGACAMTVWVNDKSLAVADGTTLSQLLGELGLSASQGVAVALNDTVVPRSTWLTQCLAAGDHVLVIQATQGG